MKKYYDLLGLNEGASIEEVKKRFKKLTDEFNEQTINDNNELNSNFSEIQEAFEEIIKYKLINSNLRTDQGIDQNKSNNSFFKGKIVYVLIIIVLVLFPVGSYLIFLNKLKNAEEEIKKIENRSNLKHQENEKIWKERYDEYLANSNTKHYDNPDAKYYFSSQFFDATIRKDTVVSFVFSEHLQYNLFKENYFKCLFHHSVNKNNFWKLKNGENSDYLNWIQSLKKKYKLDDRVLDKILLLINSSSNRANPDLDLPFMIEPSGENADNIIMCKSCFKNGNFQKSITLNQQVMFDIEKFTSEYMTNARKASNEKSSSKNKFNFELKKHSRGMNSSLKKKLNEKIRSSDFSYESSLSYSFTGKSKEISKVEYSFPVVKYDLSSIKGLVNEVYADYYSSNSLYTGAKPYSYCYGSKNSCDSYYYCSEIKVKAGYSDMLVTIKKGAKVYRHAYIKGSSSYTFKVDNGTYNVYFYSGKGWNPKKVIKNTRCGPLKGGFVSNESVSKDEYLSLDNQIMTYTMQMSNFGNFNPKGSNLNDAF